MLLGAMFRHGKVIVAWGDGADALTAAVVDTTAPGIVLGAKYAAVFAAKLVDAVGMHRARDWATWLPEPAAP